MLTAGISTSAGQFALILGENQQILFDSSNYLSDNELDDILRNGLAVCQREVRDISQIIVDIGPGGTSRVRTGIAFANALAYSLNIPVCPVSSMELAGIDASSQYGLPVVSSVKSIKGNAYIGFYSDGELQIEYGQIDDIVPQLVSSIDSFAVVGAHREAIAALSALDGKNVIDSGKLFGDASIFIEKSELFSGRGLLFPKYAMPITEQTI